MFPVRQQMFMTNRNSGTTKTNTMWEILDFLSCFLSSTLQIFLLFIQAKFGVRLEIYINFVGKGFLELFFKCVRVFHDFISKVKRKLSYLKHYWQQTRGNKCKNPCKTPFRFTKTTLFLIRSLLPPQWIQIQFLQLSIVIGFI